MALANLSPSILKGQGLCQEQHPSKEYTFKQKPVLP